MKWKSRTGGAVIRTKISAGVGDAGCLYRPYKAACRFKTLPEVVRLYNEL